MKSYTEYLSEAKQISGVTSKDVINKIKALCGRNFKFMDALKSFNATSFRINHVSGDICIYYEDKGQHHFSINVVSQNLTDKNFDEYFKIIAETQELLDYLKDMEHVGWFKHLQDGLTKG